MSDTMTTNKIETFAQAEKALALSLPGYEARPQQQTFAARVEQSFAEGGHLMAEAGCGVGKSLGYLIPAIIASQDGKRTVVTTATKALQDQVANKDLPFLAEHLGVDFTPAILKGRSNYACQARMSESTTDGVEAVKVHIKNLKETPGTWNGEREDLPFEVSDPDWRSMVISSEDCPGKKQCPFGDTCYAEAAKDVAREADVVVVNHALFFTDLLVKQATFGNGSMIGDYDQVVADEAHELEEWASSMLGTRVSEKSFTSLTADVRSLVTGLGNDEQAEAVTEAGATVTGAAQALWETLTEGRLYNNDLLEHQDEWVALANSLSDFSGLIGSVKTEGASDKVRARKKILVQRASNLARKVVDIITASQDVLVRWVEEEKLNFGSRRSQLVLKSAPIEIGDILRNLVWDHTPAVLVSATMSVAGSFDYIAKRLGIDNGDSVDVGTPFSYEKQAGLYVPKNLPSPKEQAWLSASLFEMDQLVRASDGRALLLFTSRKQMTAAYEALTTGPRPLPYQCLMQGMEGKSNKALAEEFTNDIHSVMFAMRSFFTGVDFQGETCSLVVIDKLPFPVPTEPLTQARCEVIERRGGKPFMDYTIPVMSLILQQGFGRLIRHREDRGIVAILDSRLNTGWGGKIMKTLPPAERMNDLAQVEAFYGASV